MISWISLLGAFLVGIGTGIILTTLCVARSRDEREDDK